jgi:hypothetical protein
MPAYGLLVAVGDGGSGEFGSEGGSKSVGSGDGSGGGGCGCSPSNGSQYSFCAMPPPLDGCW